MSHRNPLIVRDAVDILRASCLAGEGMLTLKEVEALEWLASSHAELVQALDGFRKQHQAAFQNFNDEDGPCLCPLCVQAGVLLKKARGG